MARGVGVMVEDMCLLVFLIGRLGRHGAGLVGVLNEVPAAVEHEFGLTHLRCSASPRLLRTCWRKMDLHIPLPM